MANLFIDPTLLATPQLGCSKESFLHYVEQLTQWQEFTDCEWSRIFFCSKTINLLFEQNRYPIWDEVEKIISAFSIDHIQPKDIVVLVDSFLQKFIKVEEWLHLDEYLYENLVFTPNLQLAEDEFTQIFGETLVLMTLKSKIDNEQDSLQLLVTDKEPEEVGVSFTLLVSQFRNNTKLEDDQDFDGIFKCCSRFDELSLKINYSYLWSRCCSDIGYKRLIELFSSAKKLKIGISEIANEFVFGKNFLLSMKDLGFKNEHSKCERLLRALSDLLLDANLASTHALRKNKGGNSPQIEENGFKAWRKDIDYEYHVHYWKKDNDIVFANVVPHNDFNITSI